MNRTQIEDLAKTLPRHECDDCGRSLAAVLSECPGCWGLHDSLSDSDDDHYPDTWSRS